MRSQAKLFGAFNQLQVMQETAKNKARESADFLQWKALGAYADIQKQALQRTADVIVENPSCIIAAVNRGSINEVV